VTEGTAFRAAQDGKAGHDKCHIIKHGLLHWPYGRMPPVTMALRTNAACYTGLTDECCLLQELYRQAPYTTMALLMNAALYKCPTTKYRPLQRPYTREREIKARILLPLPFTLYHTDITQPERQLNSHEHENIEPIRRRIK